jgi:hypothetical protein
MCNVKFILITIVPIYMYPTICTQIPQTNKFVPWVYQLWSKGTIAKQIKCQRLLYLLHYSLQRSTLRSAKAAYLLVPLGTKNSKSKEQKVTKMKLHPTPLPLPFPVIICPITLPLQNVKPQG